MFEKITPEGIAIMAAIVFGAIVHATAQLKVARDTKLEFTFSDFIILMVIAIFSGGIFGLITSIVWPSVSMIILFSAIGAFLGMAGLNKISSILLDVIAYRLNKGYEKKD